MDDFTAYQIWYRHSGQPELDAALPFPMNDETTISDLQKDVGDETITHLSVHGDIPDELWKMAPNLVSLKLSGVNSETRYILSLFFSKCSFLIRNVTKCQTEWPIIFCRIPWFGELRTLDISGSYSLEHGLPEDIYRLSHLKTLKLRSCNLKSLEERYFYFFTHKSSFQNKSNLRHDTAIWINSYLRHLNLWRHKQSIIIVLSWCFLQLYFINLKTSWPMQSAETGLIKEWLF